MDFRKKLANIDREIARLQRRREDIVTRELIELDGKRLEKLTYEQRMQSAREYADSVRALRAKEGRPAVPIALRCLPEPLPYAPAPKLPPLPY